MTCFERIVNNDPQNMLAGEWRSIYRVTMHKDYDLNVWHKDFDDIMRRIGAEIDGDVIRIDDEPYYVDCINKHICELSKNLKPEVLSHE